MRITMKITQREMIMLIVLGFVALVAAAYYLVVTPQLHKLDMLKAENMKVKAEVDIAKVEISPDNRLHKDYEVLNQEVESETARFFPAILQDKLVVIIDDLIKNNQIKADSISFTKVEIKSVDVKKPAAAAAFPLKDLTDEFKKYSENAGNPVPAAASAESEVGAAAAAPSKASTAAAGTIAPTAIAVEKMTAALQYSGSYEQLMGFIKEIEGLNKTVVIRNLAVSNTAGYTLAGTIQLEFYALPKIHEQDQQYFEWLYKGQYGKNNPFR